MFVVNVAAGKYKYFLGEYCSEELTVYLINSTVVKGSARGTGFV